METFLISKVSFKLFFKDKKDNRKVRKEKLRKERQAFDLYS